MKKITMHYAELETLTDIEQILLGSINEAITFPLALEPNDECVYLVSMFDEVYVTESIAQVSIFIKMMLNEHPKLNDSEIHIFLQEYESFEEAYKVSLSMQEVSPLCYNK